MVGLVARWLVGWFVGHIMAIRRCPFSAMSWLERRLASAAAGEAAHLAHEAVHYGQEAGSEEYEWIHVVTSMMAFGLGTI